MAKIDTPVCWLIITLIQGYQLVISPLVGLRCRFIPTCSRYAIESIKMYGVMKGSWLSVKRLLRCQPSNSGGYDPVPLFHKTKRD